MVKKNGSVVHFQLNILLCKLSKFTRLRNLNSGRQNLSATIKKKVLDYLSSEARNLQRVFFVFRTQKGVIVPGVPSGDRENWE